ncbi:hypothetical protein SEHO0A_01139 [Salmonella enterica subsp. houtenae str. ATCC BAA-1581]|nr:hypothetical protein SEHO0A_01139 [Salmonella enterica subsp. houtenae str. ATCC BAA-1581]
MHFRMPRVLMMMAKKFSFFTTWGLILSEVVRMLLIMDFCDFW